MTFFRTTFVALVALVALAALPGCDAFGLDDEPSPNGAAIEDILDNPTDAAITNLAVGIEASARTSIGAYLVDTGVLGREYWRVSPSDPRFTQDLLGKAESVLDNNTFYITQPWGARYGAIRNANTMLLALDLNPTLSDAQKAGGRGFAKTWIAYQYLLNLNLTFENGIRFIGPGEETAGPLVGYDESLDRIAALLDEAAGDLDGGAFFFPTSISPPLGEPGFVSYPQFNRALAARVDAYREDWQGVLDALDGSFIDAAGDLTTGAYHVFSNNAGDVTNPLFFPRDGGGDGLLAHPSFIADTLAGDLRDEQKTVERTDARTFDFLTSNFDVAIPATPTSPLPIIRNAELLLLRAEANAQLGNGGVEDDINVIRNAAGLEDYDGDTDTDSLINEILYQRRYELYAEGHRWLDLRRYGRLGVLPIDREGDDVFDRFPVPEQDA